MASKGRILKRVQAWLGLFLVCGLMLEVVPQGLAAERSYEYERIAIEAVVQTDTTVRIQETQTYRFQGAYHQASRFIPLRGVDTIDAVSVRDTATGQSLVYSESRLDKAEPQSFGRYTTYQEGGNLVIEWYYDEVDTTHSWTLAYTLHGAIGFLQDRDELYWNLFTEYTVPVKEVVFTLSLPQAFASVDIPAIWYTTPPEAAGEISYPDAHTVVLRAHNFPALGQATVAIGWPRGALDRSAYWKSFLWRHAGTIFSWIVVLSMIILVGVRYVVTERWRMGRGVIVATYEPPRALPPAMAEVIITETVSERAWSATIIDLAIRGYVKIEELPITRFEKIAGGILLGLLSIMLFGLLMFEDFLTFAFISSLLGAVLFWTKWHRGSWLPQHYRIIRLPLAPGMAEKLEQYEQGFLEALFPGGKTDFSTRDMKRADHQDEQRALSLKLIKLRKILLEETATDTGAYEVGFRAWPFVEIGLIVVFCGGGVIFSFILRDTLAIFPVWVAVFSIVWAWLFFRYQPRLNRAGQIFKEEWLGFKLYLKTAERYRLQNLTPETFEKYLPYAIIFGVEKEWGKAFANLALNAPHWYVNSTGLTNGSVATSFSAPNFAASFGASFASSFSSAGGGGASSGGGRAGGGGGGGGGGAS